MQPKRVFFIGVYVFFVLIVLPTAAMAKVHAIAFGRLTPVQCFMGYGADEKPIPIKVRALIVDGRVKEYVTGAAHDVTERMFVVRRAFRVNDSLPADAVPRWQWQRGGWLLVDRTTGRVSAISLSDFDPVYSSASWYRDYVAYCGITDDGKKTYATVTQLSRRKPILRKQISEGLPENAGPDSACGTPEWQRNPVRVSFEVPGGESQTFSIRGRMADLVNDTEDEE